MTQELPFSSNLKGFTAYFLAIWLTFIGSGYALGLKVSFETVGQLNENLGLRNRCSFLLGDLEKSVATSDGNSDAKVYLAALLDLHLLLRLSGRSDEDSVRLHNNFFQVLSRSKDPMVEQIAIHLLNRLDKLVVCVTNVSCHFDNDAIASLALPGLGNEIVINPNAEMPELLLKITGQELGPGHGMAILFHELQHFQDIYLFRDWIQKNLDLPTKERDSLFKSFVRVHEGRAFLNGDFFRIFSEARAYAIMSRVLRSFVNDSAVLNRYDKEMRVKGFRYLNRAVGTLFLSEQGVTEDNLFEIWQKWLTQMTLSPAFK